MKVLEEIKKRAAAALASLVTPGQMSPSMIEAAQGQQMDHFTPDWVKELRLPRGTDHTDLREVLRTIPRLVAALEYAIEAMRECEDMEGNERHDLSLAEIESILAGARDAGKK